MNAPELTLKSLSQSWLDAKQAEDTAKADRLAIEELLVAQMPAKIEGSVNEAADGFKINVTYKVTRKVDAAALTAAWATLPEVVQSAFAWKPDVSMTQLRALEKAAPDQYAAAINFITTAPAKPAVKIEVK